MRVRIVWKRLPDQDQDLGKKKVESEFCVGGEVGDFLSGNRHIVFNYMSHQFCVW